MIRKTRNQPAANDGNIDITFSAKVSVLDICHENADLLDNYGKAGTYLKVQDNVVEPRTVDIVVRPQTDLTDIQRDECKVLEKVGDSYKNRCLLLIPGEDCMILFYKNGNRHAVAIAVKDGERPYMDLTRADDGEWEPARRRLR